jgi:inner membrane protein
MDLFTHFLVPFIILSLLKIKNKVSGAFGGISIDFDFVLFAIGFLSPELFIFSHRGITHSFLFGLVTAIIFIYIISRRPVKSFISKLIKRPLDIEFNRKNVFLAYFGVLIHLFLDYLTTGGIPLFYPISLTRFSANIYYYTDAFTTILAIAVIIILYLRLQTKYQKIAMAIFMVVLISLGGIRAYEKLDTIQSQTLSDGYIIITAYPTSDVFTWKVVESDGGSKYRYYTYNNLKKENSTEVTEVKQLTIQNGSYQEAQEAVHYANNLPEVRKFKWNSHYTILNANYESGKWFITYSDILRVWGPNNITVRVS